MPSKVFPIPSGDCTSRFWLSILVLPSVDWKRSCYWLKPGPDCLQMTSCYAAPGPLTAILGKFGCYMMIFQAYRFWYSHRLCMSNTHYLAVYLGYGVNRQICHQHLGLPNVAYWPLPSWPCWMVTEDITGHRQLPENILYLLYPITVDAKGM